MKTRPPFPTSKLVSQTNFTCPPLFTSLYSPPTTTKQMPVGKKDESEPQMGHQTAPGMMPQMYRYVQSPLPFYIGFPANNDGHAYGDSVYIQTPQPPQYYHQAMMGDLGNGFGAAFIPGEASYYNGPLQFGFMPSAGLMNENGSLYPLSYGYMDESSNFPITNYMPAPIGGGLRSSASSNSLDVITPYSSELGTSEVNCGTSSSGTNGKCSPTHESTTSSVPSNDSAAHVRPLDVITPELFQAIHAPAFYKTTNPQQPTMYYAQQPAQPACEPYANMPPPKFVPPINTLTSMAYPVIQAPPPMALPPIQQPNSQKPSLHPVQPTIMRLDRKMNLPPSVMNGSALDDSPSSLSIPNGKDLLPSVIGSDGKVYQKPPGSYASLITRALTESPDGKMTLSGIYDWIKKKFPYYQSAEAAWQVTKVVKNIALMF